jgi:hypothetical protein
VTALVTVQVVDNLDHHHQGQLTEATTTAELWVKIGKGQRRAVRLDLTEAHAKDLAEALAPYLEAGERLDDSRAGGGPPRTTPAPGASGVVAARVYNQGMEAWGNAHGQPRTDQQVAAAYYPTKLRKAYADYLAQGGVPWTKDGPPAGGAE